MIKLKLYISDSYDVFDNQAKEAFLLEQAKKDEMILYLWQNRKTIVIGKNQDAYSECDIEKLESDDGRLARRITGGGAVYHDTGNLNFTFVCARELFDIEKQDEVILNALRNLGFAAEKNGRNDLCIQGRKFSGHAYYKGKENCLHHGTLMLEVDGDKLQEYLHVSKVKLHSKNVASVKSRVINLKEIDPALNIEKMKEALVSSFEEVYRGKCESCVIDLTRVAELRKQFSDAAWRYGKMKKLPLVKEKRFDFGTVRICYELNEDTIENLVIYTDALDTGIFDGVETKLIGKKISAENDLKDMAGLLFDLLKEVDHAI